MLIIKHGQKAVKIKEKKCTIQKIQTQQSVRQTKFNHGSLVKSSFCNTCAVSQRSSSQIRIVGNDMSGKDKEFLSFIGRKKIKVVT